MLIKIRNPENQDFLSCRSVAAAAEVEEAAAAAAQNQHFKFPRKKNIFLKRSNIFLGSLFWLNSRSPNFKGSKKISFVTIVSAFHFQKSKQELPVLHKAKNNMVFANHQCMSFSMYIRGPYTTTPRSFVVTHSSKYLRRRLSITSAFCTPDFITPLDDNKFL